MNVEKIARIYNSQESRLQPVACLPRQQHTAGKAWSGGSRDSRSV